MRTKRATVTYNSLGERVKEEVLVEVPETSFRVIMGQETVSSLMRDKDLEELHRQHELRRLNMGMIGTASKPKYMMLERPIAEIPSPFYSFWGGEKLAKGAREYYMQANACS